MLSQNHLFGTLHTPIRTTSTGFSYTPVDSETIDFTIDETAKTFTAQVEPNLLTQIKDSLAIVSNTASALIDLQSRLTSLNTELQTAKTSLNSSINTLNNTVDKNKQEASKVFATKSALEDKVSKSDLEKELDKVDNVISGLKTSLNKLSVQIEADLTALKSADTALTGRITALEDSRVTTEAFNSYKEGIAGELSDVNAKFDSYYDKEAIDKQLSTLGDSETIANTYLSKNSAEQIYLSKESASKTYTTQTQVETQIKEVVAQIPKVDLTPYAKAADVTAALDLKADKTDVYTKEEIDLKNYLNKTEAQSTYVQTAALAEQVGSIVNNVLSEIALIQPTLDQLLT